MKKLTFIFVLVILITITPLTAHANYNNENGNIIDGTQSVNADLEEDKDKIMKSALEDIREHYGDDSIDENVIDLNKAIKVNFYMPFLEKDDLTLEDVKKLVDNENTAYNILLQDYNGRDFGYIDIIKNEENHWCVSSVGFDEYKSDYLKAVYDLLDDYKIKNSSVYFVNCIGNLPEIVLVVFRENSETAEFIVVDDLNINSKKELEFIPNTELGKRTYTYNEIKQFGAEYEMNHDSSETLYTGYSHDINNNFQYALIAGGAVLGLCAAALIINLATKKRAKV